MEIKDIIIQIHGQWLIVKGRAVSECERAGLHDVAEKYRACGMFRGTEDLQGLVGLLTSPQGMELCMRYRFPKPESFRQFKPFHPERYGVYIDAGEITLENPEKAVLVGRTSATVNCDVLARHDVFLLHGAKAVVNASGWAVVSVNEMKGCQLIRNVSGNALIL